MIRCLLFGHEPHPTYETSRGTIGGISRRYTFCVRCDEHLLADAADIPDPWPLGSSFEEREAVLAETIVATLLPVLLPHTLKRKRATRKANVSAGVSQEEGKA